MHLPARKEYRAYWIASLCIAALVAVLLIFIPGKADHRDSYPEAFSAFLEQADSIIGQLSLDEKVTAIFLTAYPSAFNDTGTAANGLLPFVYTSPKGFLDTLRQDPSSLLPSKNQLLSLTQSKLFSQAMSMTGNKAFHRGIHIWKAPDLASFDAHPGFYTPSSRHLLIPAVTIHAGDLPVLGQRPHSSLPLVLFLHKDTILAGPDGNQRYFSEILRQELNYQGVIAAPFPRDDLQKHLRSQNIDLFLAGSKTLPAKEEVKTLTHRKEEESSHLEKRLRRVVSLALWQQAGQVAGDSRAASSLPEALSGYDSLTRAYYSRHIMDRIKRESSVLLSNPGSLLPLDLPSGTLTVYVPDTSFSPFIQQLDRYTSVDQRSFIPGRFKLSQTDTAVVVLCGLSLDNAQLTSSLENLDRQGASAGALMVVLFDPEARADSVFRQMALMHIWSSHPDDQRYAAQAIAGGQSIRGKHPRPAPPGYQYEQTTKNRLGYASPHVLMLDTAILNKMDSIVSDAISSFAFPGCQVFFSYRGDVVFQKSYGHHTYARQVAVKDHHVYDLASITKVAATTLKAMHLTGKGELHPHHRLGRFFKDTIIEYTRIRPDTIVLTDTLYAGRDSTAAHGLFSRSDSMRPPPDTIMLSDSVFILTDTMISRTTPSRNIFKCSIGDLLIHKSGLPPSLPILPYILYARDTVLPLPASFIIHRDSLLSFDTLPGRKDTLRYLFHKYFNPYAVKDTSDRCIAGNMYLRNCYADTLWMNIKQTRVYSDQVYMYSDLNPVLVQIAMDSLTGRSISQYLQEHFYRPLGLKTMGYTPLSRFSKDQVVPTEKDIFWRRQLLHGHVHDPSAALMGGVAGNAGLFSNAKDLGILFQMFLQNGSYGGRQYLEPSVIQMFTQKHKRSHRGMGFDLVGKKNISAKSAPAKSYGHTGFTGTCVWADPQNSMVYVFLSNRVHPNATNQKINSMRIRQKLHQAFYDAMIPFPE